MAWAMAAALFTAMVVLCIAGAASRTGPSAPFAARVQFALRADLVVVAWLAAAIANVAARRFFSERDIGGSVDVASEQVRMAKAVLQNTVEQVGLAVVTHLIVAATFDRSSPLIAALVCLFAVGRLLFWAGYGHGATGRAFGFALTFYPSILALLASATAIIVGRTA